MHAEAMLSSTMTNEAAEAHALEKRACRPRRRHRQLDVGQRRSALARTGALRGDAQAERVEPGVKAREMLLGEELRGRHERALVPGFDREQRRERGQHRLARADIALHETQHRCRAREVLPDLRRDAPLRLGEVEGQPRQQVRAQGAVTAQRRRCFRTNRQPQTTQAQVLCQQLFECKPALRRMAARIEGSSAASGGG
jgi:hypothetical protein